MKGGGTCTIYGFIRTAEGMNLFLIILKPFRGDIWELRPLRDRIFFAAWTDNSFVLLHHFLKKTQKTPNNEIEKAKQELKDFQERNDSNGF